MLRHAGVQWNSQTHRQIDIYVYVCMYVYIYSYSHIDR